MPITFLSAGEEVFVLRFAGDAVMVEFAFPFIVAPLKVATSTASPTFSHGVLCTLFGAWQKSLIASLTFNPCGFLFRSLVVTDFVLCKSQFFSFQNFIQNGWTRMKVDENGWKWTKISSLMPLLARKGALRLNPLRDPTQSNWGKFKA